MSRISSAIVLAMLVLTGAMGLKTVVTTHGDSSVLMANGTAPVPPTPWKERHGTEFRRRHGRTVRHQFRRHRGTERHRFRQRPGKLTSRRIKPA